MRKMLLTIAIAVLAALMYSCTDSKTREALSVSERVIMERPDSALSILDSVSPDKLKGAKDRALYGLLRTMALDKNHMEIADDSLIDRSVDYFRRHSDKRRLATALYYQGRVKYLNGNQPLALVTYMQAIEAAEEIDDRFYVGMACRGISDIYSESFNAGDELEYAKREYENIKASGKQPYINYAMLDLARAYHSNGDYKKVQSLARELTDSAISAEDMHLYESALRIEAKACMGEDNPKKAIILYSTLSEKWLSNAQDSLYLAVCYTLAGEITKGALLLDQVHTNDSLLNAYSHYHVRNAQGRYRDALLYAGIMDSITNETLQQSIRISNSTSVSNYFDIVTKQQKKEIETSKIIIAISIISGILLAIMISWITISVIRKQKKEIQNKIIFAEQLKELLQQSDENNKSRGTLIKELLSSKYKLLDELCDIVQRSVDSKSARKKIADKVTDMIKDFSLNGAKIQVLGKEIDKMYDNLYSDLKAELPELKDMDYSLFIFSVLGFSNIVISLFLQEEKINKIYDRKRRLKDKIRKLEKNKSEKFLRYMQ